MDIWRWSLSQYHWNSSPCPKLEREHGYFQCVCVCGFLCRFTGSVIIGAGTGLTAALSVLRELIHRKQIGDRVPKYCWFVWSCTSVDELPWLWDCLRDLIADALRSGVLQPTVEVGAGTHCQLCCHDAFCPAGCTIVHFLQRCVRVAPLEVVREQPPSVNDPSCLT